MSNQNINENEEENRMKQGEIELLQKLKVLIDEIKDNVNNTVKSAGEKYEPSLITRYALDLATAFNKFYIGNKIACDDQKVKSFRLAITKSVKITLTNALTLLGIETVEQM